MSRVSVIVLGLVFVSLATMFFGCAGQRETDEVSATSPPSAVPIADEDTEVKEALAQLSPADRQLAEAQKLCPVTEEPLGSMGTPLKVTVEGHDIFVCCAGCEDELKANFDEFLAKLKPSSTQQ